mgnify:CR=1 FL=1
MKRDLDLIREILLALESQLDGVNPGRVEIRGWDENEVNYHTQLLSDRKFIELFDPKSKYHLSVQRITDAGHDYLDVVRDPEIWRKVKIVAEESGVYTVSFLKKLAEGFIKKKVKQHAGYDL